MWLFTTFGFFSIVEKEAGDVLTVRARVRKDLDRLRERYLPTLSPTEANTGTDYPYRATASRSAVADAMSRVAEDIRYPNFKDAVADELGPPRAHLYHSVWSVLYDAEAKERPPSALPARLATGRSRSEPDRVVESVRLTRPLRYGGVVVNGRGEVLLYEPLNHFGGYAWTFPKGTPNPGEAPEETALREVREESGVSARVIARLPGVYRGTTSDTVYFLMALEGEPGEPRRDETQAVTWAAFETASTLINRTTVAKGRERDLRILEDARALFDEHRPSFR